MLQIIDVRMVGEDGDRRRDDDDDSGSGGSSSSQRKTVTTSSSSATAAEAGEGPGGLPPPPPPLPCWHQWYLGCVRFVARLLLGDELSQVLIAEVERTLKYIHQQQTTTDKPSTTAAADDAAPSVANIRAMLNKLLEEREVKLMRDRDAIALYQEGIIDPSDHPHIQPYHHTQYLNTDTVLLAQDKLSSAQCGSDDVSTSGIEDGDKKTMKRNHNPLSLRPLLMPVYSAADSISARIREISAARKGMGDYDAPKKEGVGCLNWMDGIKNMEVSSSDPATEVGVGTKEDGASTHDDDATTTTPSVPSPSCFTPVGALHDDPVLIDMVDNTLLEQWAHSSEDCRQLFSSSRSSARPLSATTTPTTSSDVEFPELEGVAISDVLMRLWSGLFIEPSTLTNMIASLKKTISSSTAQESSATAHLLAALERPAPSTSNFPICFARRALGQLCFSRLMLRSRLTPHTVNAVGVHGYTPLTVSELIPPFLKPVCIKGALHVGSKALAKHIHRDHSEDWWCSQIYAAEDAARPPGAKKNPNKVRKGELVGSESTKNARSESVVAAVIGGAVWQNIHMLPHGHIAFELRQQGGYGARWCVMASDINDSTTTPTTAGTPSTVTTATPSAGPAIATTPVVPPRVSSLMFRGFLEPHAADGHEKGWTH